MGYGKDGCPFSVAYRVHDAQFWGVAQRRRRLSVVGDLGGLSAGEVLFERKGLCGRAPQEQNKRKTTAEDARGSADKAVCTNVMIEMTSTHNTIIKDGVSPTLTSRMGTGGNQVNAILDKVSYGFDPLRKAESTGFKKELAAALVNGTNPGHHNGVLTFSQQRNDEYKQSDLAHTQAARDYKSATDLVVSAVDCRNGTENPNVNGTLQAKSNGGFSLN